MSDERPLERCCLCDEATGRAGEGEDSIYIDTTHGKLGPLCPECLADLRTFFEDEADALRRLAILTDQLAAQSAALVVAKSCVGKSVLVHISDSAEIERLRLVEGTLETVNAAMLPYLKEHMADGISTSTAVPHMLKQLAKLERAVAAIARGQLNVSEGDGPHDWQWRVITRGLGGARHGGFPTPAAAALAGVDELEKEQSNG